MKQLVKLYLLYFVYEFEDGHEDVMLLGLFSSKNKALQASRALKNKFGGGFFRKRLVISESRINRLSWEEGFVTVD